MNGGQLSRSPASLNRRGETLKSQRDNRLTVTVQEEIPAFLATYELTALRPPTLIEKGVDNLNFVVATQRGRVVVRRYGRTSRGDIPFELETLLHLASVRFPVPRVLTNAHGETLGVLANGPATIFEFVDGLHPTLVDSSPEVVGRWLAEYHAAIRGFTPLHQKQFTETTRLDQVSAYASAMHTTGSGYDAFLAHLDRFREQHCGFLQQVLPTLPSGVIHSDFRPDNLLVNRRSLVAVLDFDTSYVASLLRDLSETILIWAVSSDEIAIEPSVLHGLLEGYQEVRSLTPAEHLALYPSVLLACLCDAAGYLTRRIDEGSPALQASDSTMYLRYLELLKTPWPIYGREYHID